MGYKTKTMAKGWRHSDNNPIVLVAKLIVPRNPRFVEVDGEERLVQDVHVAGPDVENKTYTEIHIHAVSYTNDWEKTGIRLRGVGVDDRE